MKGETITAQMTIEKLAKGHTALLPSSFREQSVESFSGSKLSRIMILTT